MEEGIDELRDFLEPYKEIERIETEEGVREEEEEVNWNSWEVHQDDSFPKTNSYIDDTDQDREKI